MCVKRCAIYTALRRNTPPACSTNDMVSVLRWTNKSPRLLLLVTSMLRQDLMSGWTVEDNLIQDCEFGILLGGGRQTTIRNNRFFRVAVNAPLGEPHAPIYIDNRGMAGEKSVCEVCNESSCPLDSNYKVAMEAMKNPAWAKYNMSFQPDPCVPALNSIEGNVFCRSGQALFSVGGTTCPSCALKSWDSTATNNSEVDSC